MRGEFLKSMLYTKAYASRLQPLTQNYTNVSEKWQLRIIFQRLRTKQEDRVLSQAWLLDASTTTNGPELNTASIYVLIAIQSSTVADRGDQMGKTHLFKSSIFEDAAAISHC